MLLDDEHQRSALRFDHGRRGFGSDLEGPLGGICAELAFGHAGLKHWELADVYFKALRRGEWIFLQGVERKFLSGQDQARGDAGLVRRTPADGGDQQYVLPNA